MDHDWNLLSSAITQSTQLYQDIKAGMMVSFCDILNYKHLCRCSILKFVASRDSEIFVLDSCLRDVIMAVFIAKRQIMFYKCGFP